MSSSEESKTQTFTLGGNRYDLETYVGRTSYFFQIFNPLLLLTTTPQLNNAKKLLKDFEDNKLDLKSNPQLNDKLWHAKTITDAILHPEDKKKIPAPFRMSGFVPMNLPIAVGMLTSKTQFWGLFWQWYNQTYNACVNYSNGSRSNRQSFKEIGISYGLAVGISMGISYGLNSILNRSNNLNNTTKLLLRTCIPFTAVASAGASNVILMRMNEIINGVDIYDNNTNEIVGKSKIAGKKAVFQTAFSRIVLPAPILLFPGYVMRFVESRNFIKMRPKLILPINISVITFFLWGALPAACGLFPQKTYISSNSLEKDFHLDTPKVYYFNRGL